jgi:hypothetical protein
MVSSDMLSFMESDFLQLHQGVVTDFGRPISDRQQRSFYFIKQCSKFELFDLKSMVKIDYSVKLLQ